MLGIPFIVFGVLCMIAPIYYYQNIVAGFGNKVASDDGGRTLGKGSTGAYYKSVEEDDGHL